VGFKSTPTKVLAWACLAKVSCYLIAKVKRKMLLTLVVLALNMMMLPTQGFVKKLMLTLIQRFEVAHMVKIQNLKDIQG
jgi:hypothetical protein